MEARHTLDDAVHVRLWREEGGAEVVGTLALPKARAGDDDDAGFGVRLLSGPKGGAPSIAFGNPDAPWSRRVPAAGGASRMLG